MRVILLVACFLFMQCLQAQNCCDNDGIAVICYTPELVYCQGVSCPYTLDGGFMTGLSKKLANPDHFGPNSISDCPIELVPLVDINSVSDVEDLACDIVFMGNFASDSNGGTGTFLPITLLEIVREWSMECLKNLVILFQGEAEPWGYLVADNNINPNVAGNVSEPNIFNGPFGSLTQFNQGGSFQGTFINSPESGNTVLARDNSNRPTVVLDTETNDIIFADVGIMCNGPGDVTDSPNIINDNDILACNVMALGCQIAFSGNNYELFETICQGDDFILPDGQVVDEAGAYEVTLMGVNECDSIITTYLEISDPEDFYFEYTGCLDDGFSFSVGNQVFDQGNTNGEVIISNQWGCDSTVIVDMTFNEPSSSTFDTIICEGESVDVSGFIFNQAVDTQLYLLNAVNCDSVISVNVETFYFEEFEVPSSIIIENNKPYTFDLEVPADYSIAWNPSSDLSCDDCPNPILNNTDNTAAYQLSVTSPFDCVKVYEINVSYLCTPFVPNVFSPILSDENGYFKPQAPCILEDYHLQIFDRWGNMVFESFRSEEAWDGTINNRALSVGVYIYQLSYVNAKTPSKIVGDVTLIR